MLFSRKENVFICLVAFQKFSEKYFLVFGKEEGKDKPRKKIINDRRSTRFDGAVLRELQFDDRAIHRDPRSQSCRRDLDLREITIYGAISRRRNRTAHWSTSGNNHTARRLRRLSINECDDRTTRRLTIGALRSGLSLLSLSLFPEMIWSENEGVKSFTGQRSKCWSTGNDFLENFIFRYCQTCRFGGKWFLEIIFPQNKCTLSKLLSLVCASF